MIHDNSKSEFTEQDMIDFWIKHHKQAMQSDFTKYTRPDSKRNGMYFHGANSVVILQDGRMHNATGPAFITMFSHLNRPSSIDYYMDNKRLSDDNFRRKILKTKKRRDDKLKASAMWLN